MALSNDQGILDGLSQRFSKRPLQTHTVDLTDDAAMQEVFASLKKTYVGGIQGLVNNAVLPFVCNDLKSVDLPTFHRVIDTNVYAALCAAKYAYPLFQRSTPVDVHGTAVRGTIITIGSNVSESVSPDKLLYGLTKAAERSLSQALAHQFGEEGIISIVVEPGDINTPRSADYVRDSNRAFRLQRYLEKTPLHRSASPSEIAQHIAYLLDPSCAYLTGCIVRMDGGVTSCFNPAKEFTG